MKSMPSPSGAFFTIESTDPLIRTEQFGRLAERLREEGYDVVCVSFPQYDSASSHFAKQYQSGVYGELTDVGPYTSSVFYALDRYEAAQAIREALSAGKVVLANRYSGSNMAQQGMKFVSSEQRRGYFIWLDNLEFEMLRIPRPERSFILRLPADLSESNDYEQQKLLVQVYDELAMLFPKDFIRIDCARDGKPVDTSAIHQLLYQTIEPLLPNATGKGGSVSQLSERTQTPEPKTTTEESHRITGLEMMELPPVGTVTESGERFYVPALKGELKERFVATLTNIYELYDKLCERLDEAHTHHAAALLPLATFYESNQPVKPGRYINKALQQFATSELKETLDAHTQPVILTSFSPRNELDLVADVLYQYSVGSYDVLKAQTAQLSYTQKEKVLSAYLQQITKNEVAVDAHYSFDVVLNHHSFDCLRSICPDVTYTWQTLTPRYGYDIPEVIEESGLEDAYQECFDAVLALHSDLTAAGFSEAAHYTLLRGHRFRCRFVLNLPSLQALLKVLEKHTDKEIVQFASDIRAAVATAHPLTAEFI